MKAAESYFPNRDESKNDSRALSPQLIPEPDQVRTPKGNQFKLDENYS